MGKKRRWGVGNVSKDPVEAKANCRLLELGSGQQIIAGTARYKTGRSTTVDLKMAGRFYSPGEILSKVLKEALEKANRINPVRLYPERVGELALLGDPQANLRSIAAILVKKYHRVCAPLGSLYTAIRKRELTQEECHEVLRQAAWLNGEQKDEAMLAWIEVIKNGGEDIRTGSREEEDEDQEACDGHV